MSGINTGCVHNDLGVCSDCELARLRAASNTFQSQLTDLQSKLDKAREALRPIAEAAKTFDEIKMLNGEPVPDDNKVLAMYPLEDLLRFSLTVGDLRLAAKTLDEVK